MPREKDEKLNEYMSYDDGKELAEVVKAMQKELMELKKRPSANSDDVASLKNELTELRKSVSETIPKQKPPLKVKTKHEVDEEAARLLEELLNERR